MSSTDIFCITSSTVVLTFLACAGVAHLGVILSAIFLAKEAGLVSNAWNIAFCSCIALARVNASSFS